MDARCPRWGCDWTRDREHLQIARYECSAFRIQSGKSVHLESFGPLTEGCLSPLSSLLFVTVAEPLADRIASLVTTFFSEELDEEEDEDDDGLEDDDPAGLAFSRSLSLSACSLAFCLASSEEPVCGLELELLLSAGARESEGVEELDDALITGAGIPGCLLSSWLSICSENRSKSRNPRVRETHSQTITTRLHSRRLIPMIIARNFVRRSFC